MAIYGRECWGMRKRGDMQKLQTAEMLYLSSVKEYTRPYGVKNKEMGKNFECSQ
jgi:hypothetical protein